MRPDDLILLLEVARARAFVQAGIALGVDHTTVSRRISALERHLGERVVDRSSTGIELTELGRSLLPAAEQIERAMDTAASAVRPDRSVTGHVRIASTEAFGVYFVAPVMARVRRHHPGITLELVTATRPLGNALGVDIEIGVGSSDPLTRESRTHGVTRLSEYGVSLYASDEYVQRSGMPTVETLSDHSVIYYIDALQRVEELGLAHAGIPIGSPKIGSTSVLVHLETVIQGGGIGVLPHFLADPVPSLVRVLPDEYRDMKTYVALLGRPVLRRPAAIAFMNELVREVKSRRNELLGQHPPGR